VKPESRRVFPAWAALVLSVVVLAASLAHAEPIRRQRTPWLPVTSWRAAGTVTARLPAGKPLMEARAARLVAAQVIDFIAARGVIMPRAEGRLRPVE